MINNHFILSQKWTLQTMKFPCLRVTRGLSLPATEHSSQLCVPVFHNEIDVVPAAPASIVVKAEVKLAALAKHLHLLVVVARDVLQLPEN